MTRSSLKIISGGQTGADRAALDWAIANGFPHAGWCPKGRLAEDGCIPACYELTETTTQKYLQRTEMNVRDSDATVIFTLRADVSGGVTRRMEARVTLRVRRDQGLGNDGELRQQYISAI